MSIIPNIKRYIEARYPLISLATFEERHTDELLQVLAQQVNAPVVREWNHAHGWVDFHTKRILNTETQDTLAEALGRKASEDTLHGFLVLRDAHLSLNNDTVAAARLKALIRRIQYEEDADMTVFLIGSEHGIPSILEKDAVRFEIPLPDKEKIQALLAEHAHAYEYTLDKNHIPSLVTSLQGLGEQELELLLNRAITVNGTVSKDDVQLFLEEKEQIVRRTSCVEMIRIKEGLDDVGGLRYLTHWLQRKGAIFSQLSESAAFGVDTPKGVLIVGMPGCGKSLAAKATASIFGVPLLRLDLGAVLGKYVGESESNMRRALRMAEAVSPCALWLDELEKAFVGMASDTQVQTNEVTARLLGHFLTWLQEKESPVFVIATANTINLPPELLRKGRFEEIFYVDFPNEEERKQILAIHLKKRKKVLPEGDIVALAKQMGGFAGSDIESVVKDAIESAFLSDKATLTPFFLEKAIQATKPLQEMLPDHIKKCKEAYRTLKIRPAS